MEHRKPIFFFVSHYFVHTPIDDRLDWLIDKYKEKSLVWHFPYYLLEEKNMIKPKMGLALKTEK